MLPSESNHITGPEQRKVMTTIASDIGIFSGKEKKRLELSNDELDPTHKFAIALFDEKEAPGQENNIWVYVKGPGNEPVKAEVASIAKRLKLGDNGKADVIKLAKAGQLDNEIQKLMDAYEKEVKAVKEFIGELKELSQNVENFEKIDTLQKVKDKLRGFIDNHDQLNKPVNREEVRGLLLHFYADSYSSLNITKSIFKFNGELEKFEAKLAKLDQNFKPDVEIPREKVTEDTALWAHPLKNNPSPNLLANCTAEKIKNHADSRGESAVRFNLFPGGNDGNRYAIKTDGYIYHQEPKASDKFVPYTKDGKSWILLNSDSLHYRLGIKKDDIENAVNTPDKLALDKLIYDEPAEIVENKDPFAEGPEYQKQHLDDAVKSFQEAVHDSTNVESIIYNEIKSEEVKYKDFNSFLNRFKELSPGDLVIELSSQSLKNDLIMGGNRILLIQLMKELGNEAVHYAVVDKNWEAFNKLISTFAFLGSDLDLNKLDEDGNTLLHLAIINKQDGAVKNISNRHALAEDVKTDIPNKAGKTAKELIINEYGEAYFNELGF